jgi:hypothetical protein
LSFNQLPYPPTLPGEWARKNGDPTSYKRIWIQPFWSQDYIDLPYIHEPFNNVEDQQKWHASGFTQTRFTGDMYDMRSPEPDWIERFRQIIPLDNFSWSIYRMRPGDVIPNHRDTFAKFREIYRLSADTVIRRYVIFLENWQSGHYFEIDHQPIVKWNAGTAVLWHNDTPHLAANLGTAPRFTLQLTGTIDTSKRNWRLEHANDSLW